MNATAEAPAVAQVLELEAQPARPVAVQQHAVSAPPARAMTPGDLLMIAQQQTPDDLDRLERLMAMHERWLAAERAREAEDRARNAVLSFRADFSAFRGENIIAPKSKHVDRGRAGSFSQAEFDVVCRLLSPALSRHGFSFRHDMRFGTKEWPTAENPGNVIGWVWVKCFLEHRAGHAEVLELDGPQDDQSANTPVQNMQSTASFLKRQSLLAITGTATGGEDNEAGMRKRQPAAEGADDEAAMRLVDAGEAEAAKGLDALTKWWGTLSARDRNHLSPSFKGWRATATRADQQRGA